MAIIIIVSLKLVGFFFLVDRRASVCFMDNCAVRVDN